jgi:dienelactone hydrolase
VTALRLLGAGLLLAGLAAAQEQVFFPTQDGGVVHAHLYGESGHAVVLVHGGRFNKESWRPQALELERAGFRVLALDLRGYGQSKGPGQEDVLSAPLHLDVLAAVRYLREAGAKSVAVVGGSLGGWAAADAALAAKAGEIDRIVLLGAHAGTGSTGPPEKLSVPVLFITTREDASGSGALRLPRIREDYEKISGRKELIVLEGPAHAQAMFETEQGERVMREMMRFLKKP